MTIVPDSPRPSDERHLRGYPWGICLLRFFKRLLWGALALVVVLVFVVASAVPYGNSNVAPAFLFFGLAIATFLWALAGFIPPGRFNIEIEDNSV